MQAINTTKNTTLVSLLILMLSVLSFQAHASAQEDKQIKHIERVRTYIALIQDFMNVVDSVHTMTNNPEKAAIYQMHKIEEIYKKRGETDRAIELFKNILKQTKNQSIRNAVYMRLGDLYKDGNNAKALELYETGLQENIKLAR